MSLFKIQFLVLARITNRYSNLQNSILHAQPDNNAIYDCVHFIADPRLMFDKFVYLYVAMFAPSHSKF